MADDPTMKAAIMLGERARQHEAAALLARAQAQGELGNPAKWKLAKAHFHERLAAELREIKEELWTL